MKGFCIALFVLLALAECVTVPVFLKYQWPNKCWKSFRWKMVCSAEFFACGLLAQYIGNNYSPFASAILWGLGFGWLGDIFLHLVTDKIIFSGLGIFAFLGGHIFYISAFQKAISATYPDASFITWYEVLSVLLIVGLIALYFIKKKIDAKLSLVIPCALYAVTITFMLVKAIRFFIGEIAYGLCDNPFGLAVTVVLGAILFVLSDGSLGLIMAGLQKGNKKLKWFNIGTYFAAQICLASSIFFIYT